MNLIFHLWDQTFGGFISQLAVAEAVAAHTADSRYVGLIPNLRPDRAPLLGLYSAKNKTLISYKAGSDNWVDAFWPEQAAPKLKGLGSLLRSQNLASNSIILSSNSLEWGVLNCIPPVTGRLPGNIASKAKAKFEAAGIDLSKWCVAIHWREPDYHGRSNSPVRTITDPSAYLEACRVIIDSGGIVLKLGHGSFRNPFAKGEFYNLADMGFSVHDQIYAVQISRFMVSSDSGPLFLASALDIPLLATNLLFIDGLWGRRVYGITQSINVISRLSHHMKNEEAYEEGVATLEVWQKSFKEGLEVDYRKNTADELRDATAVMISATRVGSNTIWPSERTDFPTRKVKNICLPFPSRNNPDILKPPKTE